MNKIWQADYFFMYISLLLAKWAGENNDVPIGVIIVKDGLIIAMAKNKVVKENHPLYHAEILALDLAQKKMGVLRIEKMHLYTTLEPCPMCAGAMILARVERVIIGAMDDKRGCGGSAYNLLQSDKMNHQMDVEMGIYNEEASNLLKDFFKKLRDKKKKEREVSLDAGEERIN